MVTNSEQQVIETYKQQGYFHIHCGCPDFLFYKVNKQEGKETTMEDIDTSSIEFVEVKYNSDVLHHEQQIWKHILEKLGLKYKLVHIPLNKDLGIS